MDVITRIAYNLQRNRLKENAESEEYTLILKAQEGDNDAFEALCVKYKDLIRKMTYKYFYKNPGSGGREDLEQVASTGFWKAVQDFDPEKSPDFEAYAAKIIRSAIIDEIDKEHRLKRAANLSSDYLSDKVGEDDAELGDKLVAPGLSPEEAFLGKTDAESLMRFLRDNLTSNERKAISLYIDGYSYNEIAEELNMNRKSVDNAIRRVRNKMADYMKKRNESIERNRNEFSEEEKKVLRSILQKIDD